jgi:hypothetical protein
MACREAVFQPFMWRSVFAVIVLATHAVSQPTDVDALVTGITDPSSDIRAEACKNAGAVGAPAVIPLGELLADTDPGVSKTARTALDAIVTFTGSSDAEIAAVSAELAKLLAAEHPTDTRRQALDLLQPIAGDAEAPAVADLIENEDFRGEALLALDGIYRRGSAWETRIAERLERIRATGFPVTLEELDTWRPAVPKNENAAIVYAAAFEAMAPLPEALDLHVPIVGSLPEAANDGAYPPENLDAMAFHLKANAQALALLEKASKLERCRYPVDWKKGIEAELPHLAELRAATRLLCLDVLHAAHTADSERAVRSLLSALALARSLRQEPVAIGGLVRIACHGMISQAMNNALHHERFSEAQLTQLGEAFVNAEHPDVLPRVIAGERSVSYSGFAMAYKDITETMGLATASDHEGEGPAFSAYPGLALWTALDRTTFLDYFEAGFALSKQPWPEQVAAIDAMSALRESIPDYAIASQILSLDFGRLAEAFLREVVIARITRTALAVERYQLDHGDLPPSFTALTPTYLDALPLDPCTGEALRYTARDDGYVVYSVWLNRADDGGQYYKERARQTAEGDWAFKVLR